MQLNKETLRFIREHHTDDVRSLALKASVPAGVNLRVALTQIAGQQAAARKLPMWYRTEGIIYPPHLSLEQCSSQPTAHYKANLVSKLSNRVAFTDLTGGFGIDCALLASLYTKAVYVERDAQLCRIAAHNFPLLGVPHINVVNNDALLYLTTMKTVDLIFIDPARRDGHGGKVVSVSDCEPDVSQLLPLLLDKATHTLIKLSPMLDLSLALQALPNTQEVHIVSVNNECKELLLLVGQEPPAPENIPIYCTDLPHGASFVFTRKEEQTATCEYAAAPGNYLYEPNASVMKGGAFRSVAYIYKVKKLHPNSHLYTSDEPVPHFPGRSFKITDCCGWNKKELKEMLGELKQANLAVRNFPASVAELRKRLKITDGGDVYLFATTLNDGQKILLKTIKSISV
ncbi:MAG: class I SAM-dependent methyltransferase [Mediterranea sp.]|jgi:hypothetical protein|nr:class I SAM-dependent methyltransferase [Mediterranea sp.]